MKGGKCEWHGHKPLSSLELMFGFGRDEAHFMAWFVQQWEAFAPSLDGTRFGEGRVERSLIVAPGSSFPHSLCSLLMS
jgi:hypothetical protein